MTASLQNLTALPRGIQNEAYHTLVGIRMGHQHYTCTRSLMMGDYVTNQYGGASDMVGRVLDFVDGDKVRVQWLSQHIGPSATTVTPRPYLVKTSYTPHVPGRSLVSFTPKSNNGSTAWLLSAVERGWHVVGNPATGGTDMSKGYDGHAHAMLRGKRVDVRYDAAGVITWARCMGDKGSTAYAVVVDGPGAGHTAMMWLI